MCGLTGFIGKKKYDPLKIKILMLYNMSRGRDATGMFFKTTNNYFSQKEAMQADEFLSKFAIEPGFVFLGHTRATSSGARNQKNAHPHEYDNCITIHNGTITNQYALCEEYGLKWADYDTDSQILAKVLATDKDEKGKKRYKILKDFDGTCATMHYDKTNPDVLMCFRESERPLFRGVAKEGMYFSSIEESLMAIGCTSIKALKSDCIYHISKDMNIDTKSIKRLPIKSKYTSNNVNTNNINTSCYKEHSHINNVSRTWRKDNEVCFEKGRFVETTHVISGLSMMNVYEIINQADYTVTVKTATGSQIVNKSSVKPISIYPQINDCVSIKRDLTDPKTKKIIVKEGTKGVVYEWEYKEGERTYYVALKTTENEICVKLIHFAHIAPLSTSARNSFIIDPVYIDIFNYISTKKNDTSAATNEEEYASESFEPETSYVEQGSSKKEEGDYEIIDEVDDDQLLEDIDPEDFNHIWTPTKVLIEVGQQAVDIITDLKVALEDAGRTIEDISDDPHVSYSMAKEARSASTNIALALEDAEREVDELSSKIINEAKNSN